MKIDLNALNKSYSIVIEKGLIANLAQNCKEVLNSNTVFLISDKNVYSFYGKIVEDSFKREGIKVEKYIIEPGEESKNLGVLGMVLSDMAKKNITRSDSILALGGGVVGDLAGLCASMYMRGIGYIQVPTSLLAQVDSSVGGKTAVDLPEGKNLVGAFYQPNKVLIDTEVLKTLDNRNLKAGMAEVIKYAFIKDEEFYKYLEEIELENIFSEMDKIVYRCCNLKKEVVQRDEFDKGERMLLNFGHTLGHAIEGYYGFEKYLHGEAVAIGMCRILEICNKKGLVDKETLESVKRLVKKYKLPTEDKVEDFKLIEGIKKDKKNSSDKINLIILDKIGKARIIKEEIGFFS